MPARLERPDMDMFCKETLNPCTDSVSIPSATPAGE